MRSRAYSHALFSTPFAGKATHRRMLVELLAETLALVTERDTGVELDPEGILPKLYRLLR